MSYICNKCNNNFEGKAWITINFPENIFNACSYLCYNHCRKYVLPKDHFDLIVNKEDFNHPRPLTHKPESDNQFKILTETEINSLSNEEYRKYKEDFHDNHLFNPNEWILYQEYLQEEKKQSLMETYDYYSEDDIVNSDDY